MVALQPGYAAACAYAFAMGATAARYVWPGAYRGRAGRRFLVLVGAGITLAALIDL